LDARSHPQGHRARDGPAGTLSGAGSSV